MKISASIYSDKNRDLQETIQDLLAHNVDLLHVDCEDNLKVFEDIQKIRHWCSIPIDLHIITENPEKFFPLLERTPVEYVTFQYENLKKRLEIPNTITGKKGLAITTPTSINVFDEYSNFDFILIMATIPGKSGGVFDKINFKKIRDFKSKYPSKSIHVDGGVNGEVSFILRNMGVSTAVSGSYLFKAPTVGQALQNLTYRSIDSKYEIDDFMLPLEECPVVFEHDLALKEILQTIENGKLGFCLILNQQKEFIGIISNADVRKGMLAQFDQLPQIETQQLINKNPVKIHSKDTVSGMLELIKSCSFPVTYLPVVDEENIAKGIVTFVNLVKGEI